ncbi:hypothetical protein BJ165DRAFT_1530834 [Panaeolus papilionaceus]|nr:hypothetical protein BJ165DRAFT_1530834 [Panaeolus papilionaceus]
MVHSFKRISTTRPAQCNSYCVDHILAERPGVAVEQVSKLITTHQFNNEPIRILLTSLASTLKLTNSFITSTLQEYLFREMKLPDTSMKNLRILRWNGLNGQYAATATTPGAAGRRRNEDGGEEKDDDGMPAPRRWRIWMVHLGFRQKKILLSLRDMGRFLWLQSIMCLYLIHAYDSYLNDLMIFLCLAIASIGWAMPRQSDNRHHLVVQAMAFLTKYCKPWGTTTAGVREVEYTVGRTFH